MSGFDLHIDGEGLADAVRDLQRRVTALEQRRPANCPSCRNTGMASKPILHGVATVTPCPECGRYPVLMNERD